MHFVVDRFGWWILAAVGAVFGTGPVLVLGPFGLPLLVFGVAALLVGIATEKGAPRRMPVIALGAVWLVVGAALLMDSPIHTSVGGTGVVPLHETRPPESDSRALKRTLPAGKRVVVKKGRPGQVLRSPYTSIKRQSFRSHAVAKVVACLRKAGVEIPPSDSTLLSSTSGIQTRSPQVKAAIGKCRSEL